MADSLIFLSIVSPVYRAEAIIDELVKRIREEVCPLTDHFEIVLVEDGSPDNSWAAIEANCIRDSRVKGVKLSRNFGQHNAITAGLAAASGDYIVVMDCDLQDDPKYIKHLLAKAQEGYDIVLTVKEARRHNPIKDFFANLFNLVFNWLIENNDLHSHGLVGSYSIISRKVVDAYLQLKDYYKPYLVALQWLGFSKAMIPVEHSERYSGQSSYSFARLVRHALNGIISQTQRLLMLSVYSGLTFAFIGFIAILYIIYRALFDGFQSGWASVIITIIFSTGLILTSLGVVGLYIGKIFEHVKGRPHYIVDKRVNMP
jgi:polyisoprenyl-phosphate glycosyltransferase